MNRRPLLFLLLVSGIPAITVPAPAADAPAVTAKVDESRHAVRVEIGGKLFAELLYAGHPKPVIFPVIGPGGVSMTRHWPIANAQPGEEKDHPHHRSLWFTHGDVNGVDFWSEKDGAGRIVVQGVPTAAVSDNVAGIRTAEIWQAADGKPVCSSQTDLRFGVNAVEGIDGSPRFVDWQIAITASHGDLTFGDTKEGTMGLRSNPALNLTGSVAKGSAVNSEGQTGKGIWGKPAKWVDYYGPVDGKVVGIACFDHPSNLRHPTTWHARDYGLIAANPFGLHDFDRSRPDGAGRHTVKAGDTLTLRYRWLFHEASAEDAQIGKRYQLWAADRE